MRMMMKSVIAAALVSVAAVAVSGPANAVVCGAATATTLAEVIGLGSCTVLDKTFSFPLGAASYVPSGGVASVTAGMVSVAALMDQASNPGIRFGANWSIGTPGTRGDIV